MADTKKPAVLIKDIPSQVTHEGAAYGPFNLNDYIESPDAASGIVRFFAELADGSALPQGVMCTSDGMVSGIPAKGTQGSYEIVVVAENDSGIPLSVPFSFIIKERLGIEDPVQYFTDLKAKVWDALKQNLPIPDIADLFKHDLTAEDIYYLLQRFATFTIWDVYNLDPPGAKQLIHLEGENKHYHIYDRGSCLVGAPKDLYSHERTLEDALQTARVMAREAYKRNWTVELTGFDKLIRAGWVELQVLGQKHGKNVEILNYNPSIQDLNLYEAKIKEMSLAPRNM